MLKGSKNGKKLGQVALTGAELVAFYNLKEVFKSASLLYYFNPK